MGAGSIGHVVRARGHRAEYNMSILMIAPMALREGQRGCCCLASRISSRAHSMFVYLKTLMSCPMAMSVLGTVSTDFLRALPQ